MAKKTVLYYEMNGDKKTKQTNKKSTTHTHKNTPQNMDSSNETLQIEVSGAKGKSLRVNFQDLFPLIN